MNKQTVLPDHHDLEAFVSALYCGKLYPNLVLIDTIELFINNGLIIKDEDDPKNYLITDKAREMSAKLLTKFSKMLESDVDETLILWDKFDAQEYLTYSEIKVLIKNSEDSLACLEEYDSYSKERGENLNKHGIMISQRSLKSMQFLRNKD